MNNKNILKSLFYGKINLPVPKIYIVTSILIIAVGLSLFTYRGIAKHFTNKYIQYPFQFDTVKAIVFLPGKMGNDRSLISKNGKFANPIQFKSLLYLINSSQK